jgi:hypothetical protein
MLCWRLAEGRLGGSGESVRHLQVEVFGQLFELFSESINKPERKKSKKKIE